VVVPKTKVRKIYKSESKDGTISSYTLIFSLDELSYRDVLLASKLGYLETRLYIDESQKASEKTFNYSVQSKKIPLIKIDDKDSTIADIVPMQSTSESTTDVNAQSINQEARNDNAQNDSQKAQIKVER
jgi:hypothetical protein